MYSENPTYTLFAGVLLASHFPPALGSFCCSFLYGQYIYSKGKDYFVRCTFKINAYMGFPR